MIILTLYLTIRTTYDIYESQQSPITAIPNRGNKKTKLERKLQL